MYKQKLFHFLIVLWTFCFFTSKGQIIATPSTACAPASVIFSGPSNATNQFWTLGSGMGTSNLATPNVLYINAGTYNITYTALVAGNPVSYNSQVIIKPIPSASFSYILPSSHCEPMVVNFTASGSSSNPLYTWSFGDLTPLVNGAAVTHTYTFANNFIPVMTILDVTSQCTAVATSATGGTIHVSSKPIINLSSSNGYVGCSTPFTTSLNASGSISGSPIAGGGLTYNWNIQGGTPSGSSSSNPGAVSFGTGTHTINLQVTDNNQCSNSTSSIVTVVTPSLLATVPGTVCINKPVPVTIQTSQSSVNFYITNSVTPITSVTIPNGTTLMDSVCIFTSPGLTTMTIVVPTAPGCPVLSLLKPIFVEEIIANFVATPTVSSCNYSATITLSNTSSVNNSSSLTYNWSITWYNQPAYNYGAPTLTSLTTPASVTFTLWQGSLNPYTNYQYLSPPFDLEVVSSPTGCKTHTNIGGLFKLARPSARFMTDHKKGCAPLVVNFNSTSMYNPDYDLNFYKWCDGASSPSFSSGTVPLPPLPGNNLLPSATFTYNAPGIYYPYLIISTTGGCVDTSYVDTIIVVSPPSNLSATFPGTVCAGQAVTINMSGTGTSVPPSTGIDHWHFTTDDKFFSGCYTNSSPTYSFTHIGVHNVTVTASQAGCESSNALSQTILVKGPIGKFRHETNCDVNRKSVIFHVHLQETSTAVLNFGDGNQSTINGNLIGSIGSDLTHVYANTGDYTVTLTSTNGANGCQPHVYKKVIKVRDAKARITYNGQPLPTYPAPLACTKSSIKFSAATSSDNAGCYGAFTWFFQSPPSLNPAAPGVTMMPLSIGNAAAYQTYSTVVFVPVIDTLYYYVVPALRDTFRTAGTYTIALRIKDENNCVDTETKLFRISSAEPVFTITPNPACFSSGTVQLTNNTAAYQVSGDVILNYKWILGDGSAPGTSTVGLTSFIHPLTYVTPPFSIFSASLIAQNQIGCIDTAAISWQVNKPLANFNLSTQYPCIPQFSQGNVGFTANNGYATYSVSYGDSPGVPIWSTYSNTFTNVSHGYTIPGTYTPTMKVIDAAGCTVTETLLVNAIGQPTASVFFPNGKTKFCMPGEPLIKSNSTIFISPITGHVWTEATPTSTISSASTTLDVYNNILPAAIIYTISLTVDVNGHCPSSTSATVGVYNPTATAIFSPTMFCLGQTINAGINIIDGVYKWKWFFGDNVPQPVQYNSPFTATTIAYPYTIYPTLTSSGATTVNLIYDSPSDGCSRVISIPIQIIKLESDFKHYLQNYTHCLGVRDTFISTTPNPLNLNLSYDWNFGDQTTGNGIKVPHLYANPGTYTVSMTAKDAEFSCVNTSVKNMTVFPLPTAQLLIKQSLACPNASFEIQGSGTPGVSGYLTATLSPVAGTSTLNLAPTNSFVTSASASVNTVYTLKVSDNNACESKPVFDTMFVQEPAPRVDWDTAVIIGQSTPLNAFVGSGFTYTWSPLVKNLNCDTCLLPNPISNSMVDVTYTVLVEDTLKCSIVKNTYRIHIITKVSLDVPTAFTPNGDGTNDVIFPGGWGLKKLIYFKVFNRWGQQVFESNDLNVGWDGTYQGVPQNMETYVYQVSAETWLETEPTLYKTGTFKLIR